MTIKQFKARAVAASAILLCAFAPHRLKAQHQMAPGMQMPGMDMPAAPQPQTKKPAEKKRGPTPDPMGVPQDMRRSNPGDPAARAMTKPQENPVSQQQGQAASNPDADADYRSTSRDILALQEPENLGFTTGGDVPVPELLVHAATLPAMSLDDFRMLAERNNPTLEQARQDVARSRQQGRQAGLLPNPTIGYSGEHIRGGSYQGGEQGAYVAQEFVLGGKLGLRRKVYESEAKSNELGLAEQIYRVRGGVEQAFYDTLTAQAMVVVRQRLLQVAMDAAETSHQLSNLGQADAPDVLQAEVEVEQARVDYMHAQRDFLAHFAMLAAVAGEPGLAVAPLRGELQAPPALEAETQVATILSESPTLKRARQDVSVAEARVKNARRESVPNLTVRAGEWYSGEQVAPGVKAGSMSFADAGVNVPIFNRNQGNVEAAKTELVRAQQNVTRTELCLKRQAEPLAQQYRAAQFEADRYRTQLLPRARRAYELYVMKYQQMASAYPQVLVSQRILFQLQIAYLAALDAEWQSEIALRNYTLTDGLMQPMGTGTEDTTINLPTR